MAFQDRSDLDQLSEPPLALETDARLIGRIVDDYHVPHLQDLLQALDGARKIEARHGDHPLAPVGLTALLTRLFDHLSFHQAREEAVLFPMMLNATVKLAHPIQVMTAEHEDVRRELIELARITHGFKAPEGACSTWRGLYECCRTFDAELREHIRLEEEVLFPRFA